MQVLLTYFLDKLWNMDVNLWVKKWGLLEGAVSNDLHIVGNKVKEWISNGCFKKTKHVKFSEKQVFLALWYACVSGGKKCLFFGKFDVLCFLGTPVLRFAFLPYYRRHTVTSFRFVTLWCWWLNHFSVFQELEKCSFTQGIYVSDVTVPVGWSIIAFRCKILKHSPEGVL